MADYISEADLSDVATKKKVDLDNITFLPSTKTAIIRTVTKYYTTDDGLVRSKASKTYNFQDRDEELDEQGRVIVPESTEFTDFCTALGLTKQKIITAAKAILAVRN